MKEILLMIAILAILTVFCYATKMIDTGQCAAVLAMGATVYFATDFKIFLFVSVCYAVVFVARFLLKCFKKTAYETVYGTNRRNGWQFLSLTGLMFAEAIMLSFLKKTYDEMNYNFYFFYLPFFTTVGCAFSIEIGRIATAVSKKAINILTNGNVSTSSRGAFSVYGLSGVILACILVSIVYYFFNIEIIESLILAILVLTSYFVYILFALKIEQRTEVIPLVIAENEATVENGSLSTDAPDAAKKRTRDDALEAEHAIELPPEQEVLQNANEVGTVKTVGIEGFSELATSFCSILIPSLIALLIAFILK